MEGDRRWEAVDAELAFRSSEAADDTLPYRPAVTYSVAVNRAVPSPNAASNAGVQTHAASGDNNGPMPWDVNYVPKSPAVQHSSQFVSSSQDDCGGNHRHGMNEQRQLPVLPPGPVYRPYPHDGMIMTSSSPRPVEARVPQYEPTGTRRYQGVERRRAHQRPEPFDGVNGELDEYLSHFELVSQWNDWGIDEMGMQLAMSLRGPASRCLSTLASEMRTSYQAICISLRRRFAPVERRMSSKCEFRSRLRKAGETANEYAADLSRLGAKGWPDVSVETQECVLLEQFMSGIGDRDARRHIMLGHPVRLQQAVSLAEEHDAIEGESGRIYGRKPVQQVAVVTGSEGDGGLLAAVPHTRGPVTHDDMHLLMKQIELLRNQVEQLKAGSRPSKRDVKCYSCNGMGHFARECPNKGSADPTPTQRQASEN